MAELDFVRVFDAPRELVFRCLTEPAHLACFWGPRGSSTPADRIVVDLRVGGAFETVMVNDDDGGEFVMRAVFVEVAPPERLVWTDADQGMTTTTMLFDIDGNRTEVRIHQAKVPDFMAAPEAQAGFLSSLDKLADHLKEELR